MEQESLPAGAGTLGAYGWTDRWQARLSMVLDEEPGLAAGDGRIGRVLRPDGATALTVFEDGQELLPVRPKCRPVTVGDWVVESHGAITAVVPRLSLLSRRDPSTGNDQLLAANVDIVGIVCGLDRPVKAGRIQRTCALAWDAGARPIVVLTKADVVDDLAEVVAQVERENPTVDVITTSSLVDDGLARLRQLLLSGTLVLLGESGAGKSTLVNALLDADVASIGDVRHGDHKGKHTTTARQLRLVGTGGCVIDTPGLREVGLQADPEAVNAAFADIDDLAANCRFTDCAHDTEPGCAVRAGVDAGDLAAERLAAFHDLRREAAAAALRADEHARRQEGKRFGRMIREVQGFKRRK